MIRRRKLTPFGPLITCARLSFQVIQRTTKIQSSGYLVWTRMASHYLRAPRVILNQTWN